MKTEQLQLDDANPENNGRPGGATKMSRREALAIVGKHAVYSAPAVLAILSATKSTSAHADPVPCSVDPTQPFCPR